MMMSDMDERFMAQAGRAGNNEHGRDVLAAHDSIGGSRLNTNTPTQTHTPGPWFADDQACIVDSDGFIIAAVQPVGHPENPKAALIEAANARLIAATPDLLAAVRNALAFVESHDPQDDDPCWLPQADFLRAVIAKAQGGA